MGKSHKLPFNDSLNKYSEPLELVATDLWGPAPICSDYGYKYYISFIDAYSRYTWIYFLKAKYETYNDVLHFISLVENQLVFKSRSYRPMGVQNTKLLPISLIRE